MSTSGALMKIWDSQTRLFSMLRVFSRQENNSKWAEKFLNQGLKECPKVSQEDDINEEGEKAGHVVKEEDDDFKTLVFMEKHYPNVKRNVANKDQCCQ